MTRAAMASANAGPRARRRKRSLSEVKDMLAALRDAGLTPRALDHQPDGTLRWHFTDPLGNDENALDRELAAFEEKHGYGRA